MPYAGIKSRLNGRDIEKVKQEFCQLYLEQNLELKDIVKHFKSQGLDASPQQWKTQITQWGIGKHNRESDMLFAARKAKQRKERLGKETGFKIRGQLKSKRDIDQYFRRKDEMDEKIMDMDPGRTPEAIIYFSPLTSPLMATLQLGPPPTTGERTIWDDDDEGDNESPQCDDVIDDCTEIVRRVAPPLERAVEWITKQVSFNTMRQKSAAMNLFPSLKSPNAFYATEIALSSVDEFYGSMISIGKHALVQTHLRPEAPMERLLGDLDASRYHIEMGNVYSAEVLWNSAVKRLAVLMDDLNPIHLSRLMLGVRYFCDPIYEEQRKHAIRTAMQLSLLERKEPNSFSSILRILASSPDFFGLMETLLMRGIDYLNSRLPAGDDLWFVVVKDLCGIASMSQNWGLALKCVLAMRQAVETSNDLSGRKFQRKIDCLRSCAGVYMQLRRYAEAHEMLCEYETIVTETVGYAFTYHVRYLPSLGEFRRRIGDKQGAVLALRTSWNWCNANLNLEDPEMVQIAKHLQDAETGGRYWNLI